MMASGKNAKKNRTLVPVVSRRQGLPWITIGAVVVVLLLIGGIFTVILNKTQQNKADEAAVAPFTPSETKKDPSTTISGIFVGKSTVAKNGTLSFTEYKAALHVDPTQRVAYDRFPPIGGPHDAEWADCNGTVYPTAVRNENMVHPLEHGAVWLTYNPATIAAGDLDKLKALVTGQTYIMLSPYPNLDSPISAQAWAHQLKVTSADDVRIKQFIAALRQNPFVTPEAGASCSQPGFAATAPPLDTSAPGKDAIKMNGAGLAAATGEKVPNATGAPVSGAASSGVASSGAAVSGAASSAAASNGAAASGTPSNAAPAATAPATVASAAATTKK